MAFLRALGQSQAVSGTLKDFMAMRDQRMQEDQQALQMRRETIATQAAEEAYAKQKEVDNTIVPIETKLPGLQQKMPGFYTYLMDWGKKQGFVQDVGGVPAIRQGDIKTVMGLMGTDIAFNEIGTQKILQDVTSQRSSLQQQIMQEKNPKRRAELQQQLRATEPAFNAAVQGVAAATKQGQVALINAQSREESAKLRGSAGGGSSGGGGTSGWITLEDGSRRHYNKQGKIDQQLDADGNVVVLMPKKENEPSDIAVYKAFYDANPFDTDARNAAINKYNSLTEGGMSRSQAFRKAMEPERAPPPDKEQPVDNKPWFMPGRGKGGVSVGVDINHPLQGDKSTPVDSSAPAPQPQPTGINFFSRGDTQTQGQAGLFALPDDVIPPEAQSLQKPPKQYDRNSLFFKSGR